MPSHFSDIGFDVPSMDSYKDLVRRASRSGPALRSQRGVYVRWSAGEGAELWVHLTPKEGHPEQLELAGCDPHFTGSSRVKFGLVRVFTTPKCALDGSLYGWVGPATTDPGSGAYPLAVAVPDFDLVRSQLRIPSTVYLQVAAFGGNVDAFPDDASYLASQPGGGPALAPESFIPSGLFRPGGEPIDPPRAEGIMSGHIEEHSLPTNPVTGRQFHRMKVRTFGASYDVVCDPSGVKGEPGVGGVLSGQFWFTARVLGPPTDR